MDLNRYMRRLVITVALIALPSAAQTTTRGYVRAFGEASVSVKPDLARLTVAVTTQAATAQEASAQNATRSTAVFGALEGVIGATGEIKTVSFTVSPNYNYPREGPPVLIGFTATNMVEATVGDLNLTGKLIDAAISAGATRVDSLRLTLKDEEPSRAQALRLAGQKARARAEAIALGLGVRVGALRSAEEGFVNRVNNVETRAVANTTPATTPIETGTLEIRAQITVEYDSL